MARDASKANEYQRLYRQKRKENGKCVRCNKSIDPGSASRCTECLAYAKNWQKSRRVNKDEKEIKVNTKPQVIPTTVETLAQVTV